MVLIDRDEVMKHVWKDNVSTRELVARLIKAAPIIYNGNKCGEAVLGGANNPYSQGNVSDFVSILLANNYDVNISKCGTVFKIEYYKPKEYDYE